MKLVYVVRSTPRAASPAFAAVSHAPNSHVLLDTGIRIQSKTVPDSCTAPPDSSAKYARTELGLANTIPLTYDRLNGFDVLFEKLMSTTAMRRGPFQPGAEARTAPDEVPPSAARLAVPERWPWTRTRAPLTKPAGASPSKVSRTVPLSVRSR